MDDGSTTSARVGLDGSERSCREAPVDDDEIGADTGCSGSHGGLGRRRRRQERRPQLCAGWCEHPRCVASI